MMTTFVTQDLQMNGMMLYQLMTTKQSIKEGEKEP